MLFMDKEKIDVVRAFFLRCCFMKCSKVWRAKLRMARMKERERFHKFISVNRKKTMMLIKRRAIHFFIQDLTSHFILSFKVYRAFLFYDVHLIHAIMRKFILFLLCSSSLSIQWISILVCTLYTDNDSNTTFIFSLLVLRVSNSILIIAANIKLIQSTQ